MSEQSLLLTIAILGGTGKEGRGLAYRWARAGYRVIIGSRSPEKAGATAQELMSMLEGHASIEGRSNLEAAQNGNIVALTVPYAAHRETLTAVKDALQGKILIDVTAPLDPAQVTTVWMPPAGSAAQEAREILGEGVGVATAFQTISHERLLYGAPGESDVLVTGTSPETRAEVLKLVEAADLTGWDAGPIENSMVVEGLTSILIHINKQHDGTHAGIRITGVSSDQ